MFKNPKVIKVGKKYLGGNHPILIQSMTNTKTKDIKKTIEQIKKLEAMGCDIIRVAVLDMEDAKAIKAIKSEITIPIVADIHFDYQLAIEAIENGADKLRLNPGNITDPSKVSLIVEACKARNIPIRIGVNTGSLPKGMEVNAQNMIAALKTHIDILESLDFYDIVISLKASNVLLTIEAYELAAKTYDYPLHIGVTEAGTSFAGSIKSAMGIGILLNKKIGSTIRVSLTEDPILEIRAAKEILKNLNLLKNVPNLISCPTCGRIQYDMLDIAKEIENYLADVHKNINVAIMGCPVNGPGEAKHADIGIAGGKNEALLFKKGEIIRKLKIEEIIPTLKHEIDIF